MKSIYTSLILGIILLHGFNSNCQSLEGVWAISNEAPNYSSARDVVEDASGNVYIVGTYNSANTDFDPSAGFATVPYYGSTDIFIQKLDVNGNLLWIKAIGGTSTENGYRIKLDISDNVFVCGSFYNTVDFDPGAGIANRTSAGANDGYILKLNSGGDFQWVWTLSSGSADQIYSIDVSGSDIFAAVEQGGLSGVYKINNAGSSQWSRFTGNLISNPKDITIDDAGNINVTGHFRGTVDFDPSGSVSNLTSASPSINDFYIWKLDASGNFVWAKAITGGTFNKQPSAIISDNSDNVYVTGFFDATVNFDPGISDFSMTSSSSGSSRDIYVCKFNSSGDFQWAKMAGSSTGSDYGNDIEINSNGELLIGGQFSYSADFDPGAGTYNLSSPGYAGLLWELDLDGNFIRATQVGGQASNEDDNIYGITTNASAIVHVVGHFRGTNDFDPGAGIISLTQTGTNYDAFVAKLETICSDVDGDGICDDLDNCIGTSNPLQTDADGDGIGDACEDDDGDGIPNGLDNCPMNANPSQTDTDGDGAGDACEDDDGDGIPNGLDNCPMNANPSQTDTDGNGVGDACECILPVNQTITITDTELCQTNTGTIVNTGSSESGVLYFLRDDSNDSFIAGPIDGTGGGLTLNTGTVTANTTYNVFASTPSAALDFDGVDDFVDCGNNPIFQLTNGATLEAWIKCDNPNTPTAQYVAGIDHFTGNPMGLHIGVRNGRALFSYNHGGDFAECEVGVINPGQWYHIALVVNTGFPWQTAYIDGVAYGLCTVNVGVTSFSGGPSFVIGSQNPTGANSFDGTIDEVRLWNVVRDGVTTSNEMYNCLVGNEPNLVAYYNFEDGDGSTLTDLGPNSLNGTLVNMDPVMDWVNGVSNCSSCQTEMATTVSVAINPDDADGDGFNSIACGGTDCDDTNANVYLGAVEIACNGVDDDCDGEIDELGATDNTNPTIACPGNQVGSVSGSCTFVLPDYTPLATPADNCPGVTVTQVPAPGTVVGVGTTNIVFTATDGASNTANCNFDVVVSDNTNPTITCPGNQTGSVGASCTFVLPDYTPLATVADNCPGVTVTQTPAPGTIVGTGTTNIVFTATDGSSNTASCNFNVVVSDNTNPTITCPGNQVGSVNGSCTFVLPDYTTLATVADNCPGVTVTQTPAPGTIVGTGTTNIVFTATDGASNTANCNFNVVVSDNTNPTIACPGNQVGSVGASCTFVLPDYTPLATPSDNCPGVTVTQVPAAGTNVGTGTTNIVLTATDGASNTAICWFDVVVSDNTNPTITCPGNQTGSVGASCTFVLPDYTPLATVADNCPGVTVTQTPAPGTVVGTGTTNIVLTATDGNSNTTNCNFNVVVSDNTNPTITCPGNQVGSVNGSCTFVLPDYTPLATVADNCPGVTVTQVPAPGTVVGVGTTNIVFTATDGASNTASCNFNVVVSDNTNPTITCPGNQVGSVNGSCTFVLPDYTVLAIAGDNCPGVVVTQVPAAGTNVGIGTTNIIFTATDGNSNTANCNFDVVVSDNTNPTIACPGNQVGSVSGSCTFVLPDYTVLATPADNCPGVTVTQVPAPGTVVGVGTTNIVFTATDGSSNTASCNFNVVVSDNTNPTITCPGNQVGSVDGSCNFNLPDYTPLATVTDNCPGVTVTQTPAPGTIVGTGTTNIVFTATDGSSNTASCNFNVVVSDNTAPTINCPFDQFGSVDGTCQFVLPNYTGLIISSDNCTASPTVTQSPIPGTPVGLGITVVTFTADDGNGNTSQCNFWLNVVDDTNPLIPTLADLTGECSITATAPTTTDNCAGTITGTTTDPLTYASQGTFTINWTFDDGNGNSIVVPQTVIVDDITNPDTPVLADVLGECSASATAPTTTDNCSGTLTGTTTDPLTYNTQGSFVINWTFDDGNGNSIAVPQNVIVDDITAPVADLASLADVTAECSVTSLIAPTATDNCDGIVNVGYDVTLPITAQGTTIVTWTYMDAEGNFSQQTQNVVITDVTDPVIPALADVSVECSATATTPTTTDNCAGTITGATTDPLTYNTQGSFVINWTFDDGNGNIIIVPQNVIVDDITAPVADLASLADVTAECSVTSLIAPTATDNCGGIVNVGYDVTLPITAQGTTIVTWTYMDAEGNFSQQTQNVVITDVTDPTIPALADVSDECSVTPTAPTTTDNCTGTITGTTSTTFPITAQGTTIVTWIFDDGNGNTITVDQNIIITDITSPVADNASLGDVTAECEVTTLVAPTATDNCVGAINGTHNATLPINAQGTTTVTWTYDDGNGNTSMQTQDVVITDLTAPIADAASLADVTAECEVTALTAPTATDNCVGTVTATHNATLPINAQGTTTVTWTYNDGQGNTSTQTQDVVITDLTAPVPDNASLADVTDQCEVTSLTPPTATDNCVGIITVTHDATLPITSTTVITWTYNDGNGNTSTQTQNVTITGIDVSTTVSGNGVVITANNTNASAYLWINCTNGNTVIDGETNIDFTATINGDYAVIVTEGNCTDTSDCVTVSTVGIEDVTFEVFSIYPNPSTDGIFNIQFEGQIDRIDVVDMLGRIISLPLDLENKVIDGSNLESGKYLVRLITENNVILQKEIVVFH